jgi:hypothetical protein
LIQQPFDGKDGFHGILCATHGCERESDRQFVFCERSKDLLMSQSEVFEFAPLHLSADWGRKLQAQMIRR